MISVKGLRKKGIVGQPVTRPHPWLPLKGEGVENKRKRDLKILFVCNALSSLALLGEGKGEVFFP